MSPSRPDETAACNVRMPPWKRVVMPIWHRTPLFAKAARNLPNVDVLPVQGINVYDILRRNTLVLSKDAVDALEARFK